MRNAVESENGIFTIWLTRSFSAADARQAVEASGCSGILLEAEIPAETDPGTPNPAAVDWPACVQALSDLPVYKGVVTNMAPFTEHDGRPYPEKAAPLIEAGWSCHTECYDLTGNPALWPERRAFFASQLGWVTTQPVLGVYGGRTLDSFPSCGDYRNWSVWAAEYIL